MRTRSRPSGSSFVEVAVALAIFVTLLVTFVAVCATTQRMASRSRVEMSSKEDQQRNLDVIANVLRGAAAGSLAGFDGAGVATAPSFQVVTGADAAGRILGTVQSLAWRAAAVAVDGIPNPGEVTLTQDGATRTLASRVPRGGFVVTRTANTLRVTLSTYSTSGDPEPTAATVTGDVSVSLRN